MKPVLERLPLELNESFVVKYFDYKYYPTPWHYHPEYEIVLVTESSGKRYIGDAISDFEPGNLAMIGPNIPHTYRNSEQYYKKNSSLKARSYVIHFSEASLGKGFLELPEAKIIQSLFQRSKHGLDITGKTNEQASKKIIEIFSQKGIRRWHSLIELLMTIAESRKTKLITGTPQIGYNEKESARMCRVFDWIAVEFCNEIRLGEAAKIACMNENAFSRFFSQRTRKTFSTFIQEMRLQKAAELLIENEMLVTEISFECGYNNISNFNRQFLNYYKMTPLNYKKVYLKN